MPVDLQGLTRREFNFLFVVAGAIATSQPMRLLGSLPESRSLPASDLPTPLVGSVPVEPTPWAGLTLLTLPTLLVVGRVYWIVADSIGAFAPATGVAQQFVATLASLVTGISINPNEPAIAPGLGQLHLYADTNMP